MGEAAGKAFVQQGDGTQLLAADLPRAPRIPGLDPWFSGCTGLTPRSDAGCPYHGIDFRLVQFVLHGLAHLRLKFHRLAPLAPLA